MGDLLGIRKTDRYWLVHKNVFETRTIRGNVDEGAWEPGDGGVAVVVGEVDV